MCRRWPSLLGGSDLVFSSLRTIISGLGCCPFRSLGLLAGKAARQEQFSTYKHICMHNLCKWGYFWAWGHKSGLQLLAKISRLFPADI